MFNFHIDTDSKFTFFFLFFVMLAINIAIFVGLVMWMIWAGNEIIDTQTVSFKTIIPFVIFILVAVNAHGNVD